MITAAGLFCGRLCNAIMHRILRAPRRYPPPLQPSRSDRAALPEREESTSHARPAATPLPKPHARPQCKSYPQKPLCTAVLSMLMCMRVRCICVCVYHAGYNRTTIIQDVEGEGGEDKNAECAYGCVTECMHLCVRLCVCVSVRACARACVCLLCAF